jgi:hypothetical protein
VDLNTMRELANLSAQTALNRHSQHVAGKSVYVKLLIAMFGLFLGGALIGLQIIQPGHPWAVYAGIVCVLCGLVWGTRAAGLIVQAWSGGSPGRR